MGFTTTTGSKQTDVEVLLKTHSNVLLDFCEPLETGYDAVTIVTQDNPSDFDVKNIKSRILYFVKHIEGHVCIHWKNSQQYYKKEFAADDCADIIAALANETSISKEHQQFQPIFKLCAAPKIEDTQVPTFLTKEVLPIHYAEGYSLEEGTICPDAKDMREKRIYLYVQGEKVKYKVKKSADTFDLILRSEVAGSIISNDELQTLSKAEGGKPVLIKHVDEGTVKIFLYGQYNGAEWKKTELTADLFTEFKFPEPTETKKKYLHVNNEKNNIIYNEIMSKNAHFTNIVEEELSLQDTLQDIKEALSSLTPLTIEQKQAVYGVTSKQGYSPHIPLPGIERPYNIKEIRDIKTVDVPNIADVNTKNYLRVLEARLDILEELKNEAFVAIYQARQAKDKEELTTEQKRVIALILDPTKPFNNSQPISEDNPTFETSTLLEKNRLLTQFIALSPEHKKELRELNEEFREYADQMLKLGIRTYIKKIHEAKGNEAKIKEASEQLVNCLHLYVLLYQSSSHENKQDLAAKIAYEKLFFILNFCNSEQAKKDKEATDEAKLDIAAAGASAAAVAFAASAFLSAGALGDVDPDMPPSTNNMMAALTAFASGVSNGSLYTDSLNTAFSFMGDNSQEYLLKPYRRGFIASDSNEMLFISAGDKALIRQDSLIYSITMISLLWTALNVFGDWTLVVYALLGPSLALSGTINNNFYANRISEKMLESFSMFDIRKDFQRKFWAKAALGVFFPLTLLALAVEAFIHAIMGTQQVLWNFIKNDIAQDESELKLWKNFLGYAVEIFGMLIGTVIAMGVSWSIYQKTYKLILSFIEEFGGVVDLSLGELIELVIEAGVSPWFIAVNLLIYLGVMISNFNIPKPIKFLLMGLIILAVAAIITFLVITVGWKVLLALAASFIAAKFLVVIFRMVCNMIYTYPAFVKTIKNVIMGEGILHGFLIGFLLFVVFLGIAIFNAIAQSDITMNGLNGEIQILKNGEQVLWISNFLNSLILTSKSILTLAIKWLNDIIPRVYNSDYMQGWNAVRDGSALMELAFYATTMVMLIPATLTAATYFVPYFTMHLAVSMYNLGVSFMHWALLGHTEAYQCKSKEHQILEARAKQWKETDLDHAKEEPVTAKDISWAKQGGIYVGTALKFMAVVTFKITVFAIGLALAAAAAPVLIPVLLYKGYKHFTAKAPEASVNTAETATDQSVAVAAKAEETTSSTTPFFDRISINRPKVTSPVEVMARVMKVAAPAPAPACGFAPA